MIRKRTIYRNLFINYTLVILAIIIFFDIYLISRVRSQAIEDNKKANQIVCEQAAGFMKEIKDLTDLVNFRLYQSDAKISDILFFLENDISTYYQLKLNRYFTVDGNEYYGIDDFAEEAFAMNDKMTELQYVSYQNEQSIYFKKSGDTGIRQWSGDLETLNSNLIFDEDTFSFVNEIMNPYTMELIGYLVITYDKSIFRPFDIEGKNAALSLIFNNQILYQSSDIVPIDDLLNESGVIRSQQELEKELNAHIYFYAIGDITVFNYYPRTIKEELPVFPVLVIVAIGLIVFMGGEILILKRLDHLANRLQLLLHGMERVQNGEIQSTVKIKYENDEYDIIADYFNRMCLDLQVYIEKSFMAELEQKNAELSALQNQINPHFLYNTLEAIRMKAICNGDREVGKMLYGLAIIFRSQVKEGSIISIGKELYYCKKYLEMFEFRYQDKFTFQVDCPVEYMEYKVNKFIIQPLLENYFVHGIRLLESDNYIKIEVTKENNTMIIHVIDNGKGISEQEINRLNEQIEVDETGNSSIGIRNVHKRVTAMYGKEFGIVIKRNIPNGLIISISFPVEAFDE
jgi:two-component system, sensor histidine kinase YesM